MRTSPLPLGVTNGGGGQGSSCPGGRAGGGVAACVLGEGAEKEVASDAAG